MVMQKIAVATMFVLAIAQTASADEMASEKLVPVHGEYESAGGESLGVGGGGMFAASGTDAVRLNPGLIATDKKYQMAGGYDWPARGSEYYQAGVIDSKTADMAAGFSYTGFSSESPVVERKNISRQDLASVSADSPLVRRVAFALAQNFTYFALGLSGQYIEGMPLLVSAESVQTAKNIKGVTLGLGGAVSVSPNIRVGAAIENLANRKVRDYAPRTVRIGAGFQLVSGTVVLGVDFRQRDRVILESPDYQTLASASLEGMGLLAAQGSAEGAGVSEADVRRDLDGVKPERMVIGSGVVRIQNIVRVMGAYGHAFEGGRRTLSGGIGVANERLSLAYLASRPDLSKSYAHQGVSLALHVSM